MESDRAFRLARILAHAVEVFESIERARDWLKSENRALDGQPPFELLDTDAGAQEVDDVLGRIEHGIFS
jgi:putative toxin-antitoxin system antitoxin component (TIGR02293 family)